MHTIGMAPLTWARWAAANVGLDVRPRSEYATVLEAVRRVRTNGVGIDLDV